MDHLKWPNRPLEQGSLSARTYASLRHALISGQMKSGDRLLMQDLAEQLDTSVTPVREACLRLVSEQALELRSGRFVTVPEVTRSRYLQIRMIRIALEGMAAELAAKNANEKDIAQLQKLHSDFVTAESGGNLEKARQLNLKFHFYVYGLSEMDMLVRQIENMWLSMGPILNVDYSHTTNYYEGAEQHGRAIEALAKGDGEGAKKAIQADIEAGGLNLLKYFDENDVA